MKNSKTCVKTSTFRDMCDKFNIKVKTTAAYSSWSNGLCERHNQTLTRKASTEAESSEKIRTALRKPVQPWSRQYQMSDRVYYMTELTTSVLMVMNGKDQEPSLDNIIGQDGSVIFVRHGGTLIRVHQSRLQKIKDDLEQERMTRKDPQMTSESAPDCQQHQGDPGSKVI